MRTAHCIPSILSILCILCIALVATRLHHLDLGTLKCRSTAQVQDVLWCTRGQDDAAIARSHGNCLMNRISLDTRCLYVSFNDSLIILYHILLYIYMYVYIYIYMALWHMVFRSHDSKPMRLNSACPLSHPLPGPEDSCCQALKLMWQQIATDLSTASTKGDWGLVRQASLQS